MAPGTLATTARGRLEVVLVAEVAQRGLAGVDAEPDAATATAVAAVRATPRDVRLATERRRAVAAVTGLDEDRHAVEEHRRDCRIRRPAGRAGSPVASPALLQAGDASGTGDQS